MYAKSLRFGIKKIVNFLNQLQQFLRVLLDRGSATEFHPAFRCSFINGKPRG